MKFISFSLAASSIIFWANWGGHFVVLHEFQGEIAPATGHGAHIWRIGQNFCHGHQGLDNLVLAFAVHSEHPARGGCSGRP